MRKVAILGALALAGCSAGDAVVDPPAGRAGPLYPAGSGELPAPAAAHGPVWLVGLDGASWDLIDPMLERGELPNLRGLIAGGTRAVLVSEEPTISPALWATIATGVPRSVHGVINFTEKVPGRYSEVEVGPAQRRAPAIWELVGAAGGRSWVIGWFGSYPAEPISGVYLSKGLDPDAPGPGQVHPPDLGPEILSTAAATAARSPAAAGAPTEFLRKTVMEDARTVALLEALSAHDRADFVALHLSGIDVVQHVTWKHMDPDYQPFPGEGPRIPALADVIPSYYRYADELIGRIVRAAPQNVTIVLVSDHGGGPMIPERAFHFRLPVLLEMLGYTRMREDDPEKVDGSRTSAFAISELYREEKRIWLNLAGVEAEGTVPPEQAARAAARVAARLSALRTDTGAPLLGSVEVLCEAPGWTPGDPALVVRFSAEALLARTFFDGGRELDMTPVRLRHADVSGGHRLEGVLVMSGPAIRREALSRPASLYNLAPTVLYLLGLPQDARMLKHVPPTGGVLEAAIVPEALRRVPVTMLAEYPGTDRAGLRAGPLPGETNPAKDAGLEKLRALGYVR